MKAKYLLLLTFVLVSCSSTNKIIRELSAEEKDLILQTTLNAEFGNTEIGVKKWVSDLNVYLKNPEHHALVKEFEKIVSEINSLSSTVKIKKVFNQADSNYVIYFSDKDTYARHEPGASKYLDGNYGFFWLRWDRGFIIIKGSMYVDIHRTKDLECQKHILREELTQSLGMMNDHDGGKDSIFHKEWNCTTRYTDFDKKLIQIFLSKNIRNGMNQDELSAYLNK